MTSRYPRSAPRRQGLESEPFVVLCHCWSSLRLLSLSPNLHWCKGFYFIVFVFVFWCIAIDSKAHTLPKASKTHAYIAHRNQISTCEQTHTHINTSNETRFSVKQEHFSFSWFQFHSHCLFSACFHFHFHLPYVWWCKYYCSGCSEPHARRNARERSPHPVKLLSRRTGGLLISVQQECTPAPSRVCSLLDGEPVCCVSCFFISFSIVLVFNFNWFRFKCFNFILSVCIFHFIVSLFAFYFRCYNLQLSKEFVLGGHRLGHTSDTH